MGHGPKLAVPSETVGCNCEAYWIISGIVYENSSFGGISSQLDIAYNKNSSKLCVKGQRVKFYGKSKLQILKSEVGTHSLRLGSAMTMYLGEIPVYAIQLIGRWKSDSFMKYLRKQIKQFTLGIASKF